MQVTDDMVEAAAKKLYEMRHLTRWEALGERSQDIYRVEARAMLRTAAALSDKQAGEVKDAHETVQKLCDMHGTLLRILDEKVGFKVFMANEVSILASLLLDAATKLDRVNRSALVDVPAVEPEPFGYVYEHTVRNIALGGSHREFRFFKKRRSISDDDVNEFEITETAVYTNPPLRDEEDSAEAFARIVAARKAYVDATETYNTRLALVNSERAKGNWSMRVDDEARAMWDAQSAFIKAAQDETDAALAATRSGSASKSSGGDHG